PLDRRLQVTPGEDVSRSISFHLGRKEQGVGKEADEDEHAANRQVTLLVVPLQAHTRDHAIPVDLPDPGAEDEIDAGVGPRPRLEDGLSAELTAAVDDRNPACVAGEEVSLLERRIAAPDHRQLLTLEEGAVADRAVADSPAREFRLAGHVELPRPATWAFRARPPAAKIRAGACSSLPLTSRATLVPPGPTSTASTGSNSRMSRPNLRAWSPILLARSPPEIDSNPGES